VNRNGIAVVCSHHAAPFGDRTLAPLVHFLCDTPAKVLLVLRLNGLAHALYQFSAISLSHLDQSSSSMAARQLQLGERDPTATE
jgi:hypothetical protein